MNHNTRMKVWRSPSRQLWAVLLTVVVSITGLSAQESSSSPYGINIHAPGGAELEFLLDKVEAAGIGWVRIDFVWALVELQDDVYDWTLYDDIVAAAQARRLQILAIIAYTPDWATDGPPISGVPRSVADWEEFCFLAAARYAQTIHSWEVWNEPNLDHFWDGSRSEYIDLILRPAADAIRAADPDAQVGGPALAHLISGDRDWYRWLLEVLEQAGDRLDFATHHAYDSDGHDDVTEKLNADTVFGGNPALWDLVPPSTREVLTEAGWFPRPVWLTETGWATDQVSEAQQATYYEGLLSQWFEGDPLQDWIDKIFFYVIQDFTMPEIPLWGILRTDGSEKPAYAAYRDFIGAHSGLIFEDGFESGDTTAWSITVP